MALRHVGKLGRIFKGTGIWVRLMRVNLLTASLGIVLLVQFSLTGHIWAQTGVDGSPTTIGAPIWIEQPPPTVIEPAQPNIPPAPTANPTPAAVNTNGLNIPQVRNALVFTNNQLFSGSLPDDGLFLPEDGAQVLRKNGRRKVVKGKVLVDTGRKAMSVDTAIGRVIVGPQSTAEISADPSTGVRVVDLGGSSKNNVALRSASGEIARLSAGEDFFVQTNGDDLFIPTDGAGVGRQVISGKVIFAGLPAVKSTFSISAYIPHYVTIAGSNLNLAAYGQHKLKRLETHARTAMSLQNADGKTKGDKTNDDKTELAATQEFRTITPLPITQLSISGAAKSILTTKGTVVDFGVRELKLTSGSMFVHLTENTTIKTPLADVFARKGTVLDIEAHAGALRVKICAGTQKAYVIVGNRRIQLTAGHEALVTRNVPVEEEKTPPDGIGRRHINSMSIDDRTTLIVCDYDPVAHLFASPYVQELKRSASKDHIELLNKVIKAAAAISYVGSAKGYYTAKN